MEPKEIITLASMEAADEAYKERRQQMRNEIMKEEVDIQRKCCVVKISRIKLKFEFGALFAGRAISISE